jgi:hypothetical protein
MEKQGESRDFLATLMLAAARNVTPAGALSHCFSTPSHPTIDVCLWSVQQTGHEARSTTTALLQIVFDE